MEPAPAREPSDSRSELSTPVHRPRVRRTERCVFGPPREVEFSWPPKDEDLEACAIVRLEGDDAGRITPVVLAGPAADAPIEAPPPLPVPPEIEPPPLPEPVTVPADDPAGAREWKYFGGGGFWRVERSDALARFMVEHAARRNDPEAVVAARSAWLALFVAASCLLVTYSEFRADGLRGGSPAAMLTTAFASDTDPVPSPDAVPGTAPKFIPPVAPAPTPRPAVPAPARQKDVVAAVSPEPRRIEPVRPEPVRRAESQRPEPVRRAEPQRPEPTRYAPAVITARATPATPPHATPPAAAPPAAVPPAVSARVAASSPEVPVAAAVPAPAVSRPEPLAARVETAAIDDEEDDIRTTLTRFRTAYSQLNASAAQEVWPSVDVRALRSAFRGLKSQQLHFDQCQLTVTGARARAACTGRAVYVPGVGDQSPRTSPRSWNFELTKARERWTIASARSS